ncbi:hypothetical protein BDB00DRAFT_870021 [Zychaea mexicana]|uniref:uncharacterized protein n=1 Tax=Zychaea mexicana TaxID=64656 RepID=UPI0022FDBAFC|nr:uncharacterized protein BDB00DRAFT_870021 [Zychaea mexicana]KAI9495800.1 hypothetical protein BDB00DRAFT_870021 [Zychaea mexicana]
MRVAKTIQLRRRLLSEHIYFGYLEGQTRSCRPATIASWVKEVLQKLQQVGAHTTIVKAYSTRAAASTKAIEQDIVDMLKDCLPTTMTSASDSLGYLVRVFPTYSTEVVTETFDNQQQLDE